MKTKVNVWGCCKMSVLAVCTNVMVYDLTMNRLMEHLQNHEYDTRFIIP